MSYQFYCNRCGGMFNCSPKARPMWCADCRKQVQKEQHSGYYRSRKAELSRLRAENVAKDAEIERLKAILADALEWGMTSKHFDAGRSLKNGEDARAALSRAEQAKPETETCAWSRGELFRSGCGQSINAISGFKFCPFCGRRIEVKE